MIPIVESTAVRKIIGRDVPLSYPKASEIFIIHTDARKNQLGRVININGSSVAFYTHK